ncbi:hypothetical protein IV500_04450 [Paeniglutamicibacter antarcticus]|uniref:Uncharacterized protein n=1 Tax=Arthrobacter terrae TaxID=2935737 RepID=A0A931G3H3_9MICC|nr:hypothetical protein [Arthrobacter terrae]
MPTAENTVSADSPDSTGPYVGELWSLTAGDRHAIFLGDGLWNVLSCINDEYTLEQIPGLVPEAKPPGQPASFYWADQFDALAAADGLRITWSEEILTYQAQGWDKIRKLRPATV